MDYAVQFSAVQCSTMKCGTAEYSTVQYSTIQCNNNGLLRESTSTPACFRRDCGRIQDSFYDIVWYYFILQFICALLCVLAAAELIKAELEGLEHATLSLYIKPTLYFVAMVSNVWCNEGCILISFNCQMTRSHFLGTSAWRLSVPGRVLDPARVQEGHPLSWTSLPLLVSAYVMRSLPVPLEHHARGIYQ